MLRVSHPFVTHCCGLTSTLIRMLYFLAHLVTLAWDIMFSVFPLPEPKCIPPTVYTLLT